MATALESGGPWGSFPALADPAPATGGQWGLCPPTHSGLFPEVFLLPLAKHFAYFCFKM